MLFPVHRPGELISGEWVHFFSHFQDLTFFSSIFHIISIQQKKNISKEINCAASRLATIMATRWTENKLFFKGGVRPASALESADSELELAISTGCPRFFGKSK